MRYGGEKKESARDFVNDLMFVYVNSKKMDIEFLFIVNKLGELALSTS